MIKPVLQDGYDPVTEEDLLSFEQEIGARLPEDYRQFLLKQNGGHFAQDAIWRPDVKGEQEDESDIQGLYPLHEQINDDGLLWHYRHDQSYVPKLYLPIGDDLGGCTYYLCLNDGRHYGSVWYWDRERDVAESFHRLEPSFPSFVDHITYDPDWEWEEDNPVFRACEQGDVKRLGEFFQEDLDINQQNEKGTTLLMRAAWGQPRVLEFLLAREPNLELQDAKGRRAIHNASGWLDCVKLLVGAGAEINVADDQGRVPLLRAMSCGDIRSALFLLAQGADVNVEDNFGDTPLIICKRRNNSREQQLLLEALRQAGARE